jgi:hypothetical protein
MADRVSKQPPSRIASSALGRTLGKLEHVGTPGVFGKLTSLRERQSFVRVDQAFEASEELVAGRLSACAAIGCSRPRDVRCDALVDVGRG